MKETQVHLDAFELYYSMKASRSYKKLSEQIGISERNISKWGTEFRWQDRVKERDKEIAERVAERTIEEEVDTRVLLNKATNKSILKYIDMVEKIDKLDIDKVKVLDILGRLYKELNSTTGGTDESKTNDVSNTVQVIIEKPEGVE